jgi:hypothetical protein
LRIEGEGSSIRDDASLQASAAPGDEPKNCLIILDRYLF